MDFINWGNDTGKRSLKIICLMDYFLFLKISSNTPPQALMRSIKGEVRSEGVRKRAQRAREGKA